MSPKHATLTIAPALDLPLQAVTETFAILAKRGKGKTYTGSVIAEEMIEAGQQVVIVDPLGVWWGLRAGADGAARGGLPVVILGGEHADLPLDSHAGAIVADLVVDQGLSVVLDMKGWSKSEMRRFVTDFGERLYKRNRNPLHLIVDEVDLFAHQRLAAGDERMFSAIDNLVRRGRANGIGVTMISQRAAVVNKDILSQCEVLVAMGMISKNDRKAIREWIEGNGEEDAEKKIMNDLPSLGVGEAWIYSPDWLGILKKVKIRKRRTFDSSATPKVGERVVPPKQLRKVDLEKLREQLVHVAAAAKDQDPANLKARIQELERQLRAKPASAGAALVDEAAVERRVAAATRELQATIATLQRAGHAREKEWEKWRTSAAKISTRAAGAAAELGTALETPPGPFAGFDVAIAAAPAPASTRTAPPATTSSRSSTTRTTSSSTTTSTRPRRELGPGDRVLQAMAKLSAIGEDAPEKNLVAIFAGYEPGGSTMRGIFAKLAKDELIDYPGDGVARLTRAGIEAAPTIDTPASFEELRATLERERMLNGPQLAAFDTIAAAYPREVTKDELAIVLEHEAGGSTQRGILARLRALQLVERNGIRAAEWIFAGAMR